jgi:hypothetical protein
MNRKGKRPALASKPGVKLASAYYGVLTFLANLFARADRIGNERGER